MTKVYKNIETLETIEIDSLKLRIPYDQITIVNSLIIDKIGVYNVETGEEIEEPKARNWYRVEKQNNISQKLYSYKWDIQQITLEKGRAFKYLCVQVNSKVLHQHYFKGISLDTIKLVYKQLMNEKVVSFSLQTFLNSDCTDIDFKKDIINEHFRTAVTTLNDLSKPFKQYGKGANAFMQKDNLGIEWSNRRTASPSNPYLKLYHKGLQCVMSKDMKPYYNEYLKRGPETIQDRIRIEYTIKNKKHLQKWGVNSQKLIDLLKLDQAKKNEMLEGIVKHHLLPRVAPIIKPETDLKPTDMMLYKSMSGWSDNSLHSRDMIIKEMTIDIHPKQRRSESKKKLENLWDTYIQMRTKAKENESLTHLFSALCWH
jgi:hypothetical protein